MSDVPSPEHRGIRYPDGSLGGAGCSCARCKAPLPEPKVMSLIEATAWNRAYADKRRRWAAEIGNPVVTQGRGHE